MVLRAKIWPREMRAHKHKFDNEICVGGKNKGQQFCQCENNKKLSMSHTIDETRFYIPCEQNVQRDYGHGKSNSM